MPASLQALNLDSESNLWVAGNGHVTKVFTAAAQIVGAAQYATISATLGGSAIDIDLCTSATHSPISLDLTTDPTLAAACAGNPADVCCPAGKFDAGIAITRDEVASGQSFAPAATNTVYIANTCDTGLVRFCTMSVGDVSCIGGTSERAGIGRRYLLGQHMVHYNC